MSITIVIIVWWLFGEHLIPGWIAMIATLEFVVNVIGTLIKD